MALTLSGCVTEDGDSGLQDPSISNPKPILYNDALYIGDSNCDELYTYAYTAPELAGIPRDCKGGRTLIDYDDVLPARDIVFIALGVNDFTLGTNPSLYGEKLQGLLDSAYSDVYCVLPMHFYIEAVSEYRYQMQARCLNIIDPYEYSVSMGDLNHYSWQGHIVLSEVLAEVVSNY